MDVTSKRLKRDLTPFLTTGIMLLGLLLRCQQFIYQHAMNMDESFLALNVVDRSYPDLLKPLDYNQGAPPGFLIVQKAIVQTLGDHDYSHALFPFICGLLLLFLMLQFTKSFAAGTGILVSLGIFVVSGPILRYSSEAKQYSLDVCAALILLILAGRCLDLDADRREYLALAAAGAISIWFSHAALFMMSAVFPVLLIHQFLKKDWQKLTWVGWSILFWALNFGLLYFLSLRFLTGNRALVDFWTPLYMPLPPWQDLAWFPRTYKAVWELPVGLPFMGMGAVLMLTGILSLFFRNWKTALLLTLPFFSVLAASSLKIYPFGNRLILFLVPVIYLFLAEGIERIRLSLIKTNSLIASAVWAMLVAFMFFIPARDAFRFMVYPTPEEGIKPALAYIQRHRVGGEGLYVYYGAYPTFKYYAPEYKLENSNVFIGKASRSKPGRYQVELDSITELGNVWFLFAHNCHWCKVNEQEYFLRYLDKKGTRLGEIIHPGGSAYYYRFEP